MGQITRDFPRSNNYRRLTPRPRPRPRWADDGPTEHDERFARTRYPIAFSTLENFVVPCPVCGENIEGVVSSIVKDVITAPKDRRKTKSEVGADGRVVPVLFNISHRCVMNTDELETLEETDDDTEF